MTIEFTFGDNSDKSRFFFFEFFKNLIDHDLTAHQITQTLTLSRLFTHTQQVDWSRQGESDCSLTRNKLTGADKVNQTV